MKNKFILISGILLLILFIIIFIFFQKEGKNNILNKQNNIEKLNTGNVNTPVYSFTGELEHSQASDIE